MAATAIGRSSSASAGEETVTAAGRSSSAGAGGGIAAARGTGREGSSISRLWYPTVVSSQYLAWHKFF